MSTKSNILRISYELTVGWVMPILHVVRAKPSLAAKYAGWAQSPLSDLAFTIETRIGTINEALSLLNENLAILDRQVRRDTKNVDEHIARGAAYVLKNKPAHRRVLLAVDAFIVEGRSLFENLANFYADFSAHYLGKRIKDKERRYAAVAALVRDSAWTVDLQHRRHDLLHSRAPIVELRVIQDKPRRYYPFLAFDWRPGATGPKNIVPFARLERIRIGLEEVARAVRQKLVGKVRALP